VARYEDLPVYRDCYNLTLRVFAITHDFPREYKYTLGADMKRDCLVLLRSIYRINRATRKEPLLEVFLDDFHLLRMEIRLATDLKLMSVRRQAELSVFMDTIGRQVTGWRNASRQAGPAGIPAVTATGSEQ